MSVRRSVVGVASSSSSSWLTSWLVGWLRVSEWTKPFNQIDYGDRSAPPGPTWLAASCSDIASCFCPPVTMYSAELATQGCVVHGFCT